jgi:hypothetical protein
MATAIATPTQYTSGWTKQDLLTQHIAVRTTETDPARLNLDWAIQTLGQGAYYTDFSTVVNWPDMWPQTATYVSPSDSSLVSEGILSASVMVIVYPAFAGAGRLSATVVQIGGFVTYDGGNATSSYPNPPIDGGNATTTSYALIIDGGNANG